MINNLKKELNLNKNDQKAKILQKFFKTDFGQYGKGDIFLGIPVPIQRKIAKKYFTLELNDISFLLKSNFHEYRFIALVILINKYKKGNKEEIAEFYINHIDRVNNWDLVDISAPNILGDYLLDKDKSILDKMAISNNLWERRIAIVSTLTFIRKKIFDPTIKISEVLINDNHDLIHKASGWMLREVGKKSELTLDEFLKKNLLLMPRTMLRYAIEKFPEHKRLYYLNKK